MTNTFSNLLNRAYSKNNKLITTVLYQLYMTAVISISLVATLCINILVGFIVMSVSGGERGGSTDGIAFGFSLVLGIMFFGSAYKFSIINGTSRKSYYFATLLSLLITALVWSIVILSCIAIGERAGTLLAITTYMYGQISFGRFLFILFANLMLMSLGLLAGVIYGITSRKHKVFIFLGSMLLISVLIVLNVVFNGAVGSGLGRFFLTVLGLKNGQNPFIGSLFMLSMFAVFSGFNYLLIRRAQIRK